MVLNLGNLCCSGFFAVGTRRQPPNLTFAPCLDQHLFLPHIRIWPSPSAPPPPQKENDNIISTKKCDRKLGFLLKWPPPILLLFVLSCHSESFSVDFFPIQPPPPPYKIVNLILKYVGNHKMTIDSLLILLKKIDFNTILACSKRVRCIDNAE